MKKTIRVETKKRCWSLVGVTGDNYNEGEYLTYNSRGCGAIDFYGAVDMANPSVVSYISKGIPPFLIFYGDKDNLVPAVSGKEA